MTPCSNHSLCCGQTITITLITKQTSGKVTFSSTIAAHLRGGEHRVHPHGRWHLKHLRHAVVAELHQLPVSIEEDVAGMQVVDREPCPRGKTLGFCSLLAINGTAWPYAPNQTILLQDQNDPRRNLAMPPPPTPQ